MRRGYLAKAACALFGARNGPVSEVLYRKDDFSEEVVVVRSESVVKAALTADCMREHGEVLCCAACGGA